MILQTVNHIQGLYIQLCVMKNEMCIRHLSVQVFSVFFIPELSFVCSLCCILISAALAHGELGSVSAHIIILTNQ